MNGTVQKIADLAAMVASYVEAEAKASGDSPLGRTSVFWKDIFADRPNFPSLADFLAFRRDGYGYGMADERQGGPDKERAHTQRSFEIFRQSAPPDRMAQLDESSLGAPFVFENHGVQRSAAFWTNAVTALRVSDLISTPQRIHRALDVLEIGAGWGCAAYLLHQLISVHSYTIVDLPENLSLSSVYLGAARDLTVKMIGSGEKGQNSLPQTLYGALPVAVPNITRKFDLVFNSFSFQEMELATVEAYFDWVSGVLTADGLFVSLNSHGKSGVRKPSDYPLSRFSLRHFGMFRKFPSGLLNTIPYEMVLARKDAGAKLDPDLLDVVCCLIQFGLGDDLDVMCRKIVDGSLPSETASSLLSLRGYFSPDASVRRAALDGQKAGLPSALLPYLTGMNFFAEGSRERAVSAFYTALEEGLQGFARLRACAHLAILNRVKVLEGWVDDFDAILAYPELAQMLDRGDATPFVNQFKRIVSVDLSA